jgi:hypothetical protein
MAITALEASAVPSWGRRPVRMRHPGPQPRRLDHHRRSLHAEQNQPQICARPRNASPAWLASPYTASPHTGPSPRDAPYSPSPSPTRRPLRDPSCELDWGLSRRWRCVGDDRIGSTMAHPHHRDALHSPLEFSDGRRRTAWIYTVYRLNWKYPVGGVGKPAGDSGGGSGQDRPSRIALQHQRWR